MKRDEVLANNTLVLSNGIEIVSRVILEIAGNEISNRLNGEVMRQQDVTNAVAARIKKNMSHYLERV